MVEMGERELLLGSLKGYLEELLESGLDELPFGAYAPAAAGDGSPAAAAGQLLTGAGNPQARLIFVLTGAGLAAPSGDLLVKIIQAMGFASEEVLLLSFPEAACQAAAGLREALLSRIAAGAPRVVVALGEPAAQLLMARREPISGLRGRFLDLAGISVMATLHPDQLLADAALKREVWAEMQQVMGLLKAAA